MIFVCGMISPSRSVDDGRVADMMAAARRTARHHPVHAARHDGVEMVSAGCRVQVVDAGASRAVLFRPAWEPGANDERNLAAVADTWQERGALAAVRFEGPFLLLVDDRARRAVAVATDRFGICPLYFHADATALHFSTDIDALIGAPGLAADIDPQAIYDYAFFHCIPGPRTVYEQVRKLGPAEYLQWCEGSLQTAKYWMPSFAGEGSAPPPAGELMNALEGAVASRVSGATGAFLSGGLDSSSVAGLLRRSQGKAATFTIGFNAEGYDESGFARIVADHFATDHREYFVTPDDVLDALPQVAAHYGEPFGNSSVIPTYLCARFAREHGIELMLAGDGGDELFAGNTRYTAQAVFEAYFRVPALARGALEAGYRSLPFLERLPIAGKGARYIQQAKMGLPDRLQSYNFLNRFDSTTVFDAEWMQRFDTDEPWSLWRRRYAEPAHASALQRMLYLDWKFTLADNDLVKVNHMCDLAGIEVAYPMLDSRVVDFSCQLSGDALLRGGTLRGFYKHAFETFLPEAVIKKSKHGFGLPFGVWMKTDAGLRKLADDALSNLAGRHIFEPSFLQTAQRLFREEQAAGYYGELVWILTMLELWMESHRR